MRAKRSSAGGIIRTMRTLLLVASVACLLAALSADWTGLGDGPGMGRLQISLMAVSAALVAACITGPSFPRFFVEASMWLLGAACIAAMLELLSATALGLGLLPRHPVPPPAGAERVELAPAPFVMWRPAAVEPPAAPAAGAFQVMLLGGGQLWLAGDSAGIPAALEAELGDRLGAAVEVTNLGRPGYTSTQQLCLLLTMLHDGARPDLVVFLVGWNDMVAAVRGGGGIIPDPGTAPALPAAVELLMELSAWEGLCGNVPALSMNGIPSLLDVEGSPGPLRPPAGWSAEEAASTLVGSCLADSRAAQAIGGGSGFECMTFWEPTLPASAADPGSRGRELVAAASPAFIELVLLSDELMESSAAGRSRVATLAPAIEALGSDAFTDLHILSPAACEAVARAMADSLLRDSPSAGATGSGVRM